MMRLSGGHPLAACRSDRNPRLFDAGQLSRFPCKKRDYQLSGRALRVFFAAAPCLL
jgi:hypothetical protein